MSIEGQVISLPNIFQVLYVLCFTRSRYQVSVYRTNGPLVKLFDRLVKASNTIIIEPYWVLDTMETEVQM